MSATSPENQSTSHNPYSAPRSTPSLLAKSYLTFAVGVGIVAAGALVGYGMFMQSKAPVDPRDVLAEEEIFIQRMRPD